MSSALARSQDVIRSADRMARVLLISTVALLLALATIFSAIVVRQNVLRDSIREDILWAIYQYDREARTLAGLLDHYNSSDVAIHPSISEVTKRYDILYSRLTILDESRFGSAFDSNNDFSHIRTDARSMTLAMQGFFDKLASGNSPGPIEVAKVNELSSKLVDTTSDLLSKTNATVSAVRADARADVISLQKYSAGVIVALCITVSMLIYSLFRQIKMFRMASQELSATAETLTNAYELAEAGNRAKSEFMATIGHEIRTPLNAILGMSEMLSHANLATEDRESVSVITSSGTTLLEIINEILDFAKLEAGRMQSEAIPYQPIAIANELIRVMRSRAKTNGTRIDLIAENVGAGDWFKGDPTHVRRLLFNLLGNAIKFTENGIIRVCVTAKDGKLNYAVVDTGIGIPEGSRDKLFQPFSQVDSSTSRRYGGTGLGLVICKRIVTQMGGKIGVDSTVGVGSKFWFEIPALRVDAPAQRPTEMLRPRAPVQGLKILVAEDQPVNRDVMSRYLKKINQTADFVPDGAEAVAAAARQAYDIILMDMQMPVMDGIEATRNIREFGIKTPIVALTANASDSDKELCLQAGMDGFEVKPISLSTLSRILQQYGAGGIQEAVVREPALEVAPASSDDEPAHWDQGRIDELREVLGEAGLRGLAAAFLDDVPVLVERLKVAVAKMNSEDIDLILHTIKGTAANLGFSGLSELAQKFRGKKPEEVEIGMLEAECIKAQAALSKKAA